MANNFTTESLQATCGIKSKVLAYEVFSLIKAILPSDMFLPDGHLKPDACISFGNLGFIEFLNIDEEIIDITTYVDVDPLCLNVPAIAQIKRLDLIMTIGYSEVLYNNYENHDLENSNAILGTKFNFTTIKIDGFEYLSIDADVTDYRNPDNYKLIFNLTATPDIYAPVTIPTAGVVSSGTVEVQYIGTKP
ncbi:MAG: hypothetical protein ACRC92_13950 [Peptostreptococcaceae bacterium]